MMRKSHRITERGGTLLLSLACLAVLAISAAYTLQRVTPRYRIVSQFAAWQEARLAAEAGVDVAMNELDKNALGFNDGSWSGWQQYSADGIVPAVSDNLQQIGSVDGGFGQIGKAAVLAGLAQKGPGNGYGKIGQSFGGLTKGLLSLLGSSVSISQPIFLDNLQVATPGSRPTNVDVQMWAIYPTASPYYRWFRIRAMGTCAIPVVASSTGGDRLDNALRRYSLRTIRPQLRNDDVGTAMTVPTPNTSRTIEALVEPLLPFEMAIVTKDSLSLATSGAWRIDSYDSRDPKKSDADGSYPATDPSRQQANAAIATDAVRPVDSPFGPLIALNGTIVRGVIATNGGDDPATTTKENVSGATRVEPSQIRDDFYRNLPAFSRPTSGIFLPPPKPGEPFVAGTVSEPRQYLITKNLQAFTVVASSKKEPGALTIAVNGDFDVPAGTVSIPPNVAATLYIRGNIDFHDRPINATGKPAQLQIFGEDATGITRTLKAFGSANVNAAFYGPQYDVSLMDNVTWCGAVAARSFQMLGGATGGFHYDEALGVVGAPIGFRIARYIEDVRE